MIFCNSYVLPTYFRLTFSALDCVFQLSRRWVFSLSILSLRVSNISHVLGVLLHAAIEICHSTQGDHSL
jgi:hypothetical protein